MTSARTIDWGPARVRTSDRKRGPEICSCLRMSDDYRDPLAAAHARIQELERENRALKRRLGDQPVAETDLELVRLQRHLVKLDTAWRRRSRRFGGVAGARGGRAPTYVLYGIASVFALIAVTIVFESHGGPVLGTVFGGMALGGIAFLIGGIAFAASRAMAQARAEHGARREKVIKRMEALRGVRVETRVRLAEEGDSDAEQTHDEVEWEEKKRSALP